MPPQNLLSADAGGGMERETDDRRRSLLFIYLRRGAEYGARNAVVAAPAPVGVLRFL